MLLIHDGHKAEQTLFSKGLISCGSFLKGEQELSNMENSKHTTCRIGQVLVLRFKPGAPNDYWTSCNFCTWQDRSFWVVSGMDSHAARICSSHQQLEKLNHLSISIAWCLEPHTTAWQALPQAFCLPYKCQVIMQSKYAASYSRGKAVVYLIFCLLCDLASEWIHLHVHLQQKPALLSVGPNNAAWWQAKHWAQQKRSWESKSQGYSNLNRL